MASTFTVQADSEVEARAEVRRLCAALGLEPLGRPMQFPGSARWMARAVGVEKPRGTGGTAGLQVGR